jgi:hypothetical protein
MTICLFASIYIYIYIICISSPPRTAKSLQECLMMVGDSSEGAINVHIHCLMSIFRYVIGFSIYIITTFLINM